MGTTRVAQRLAGLYRRGEFEVARAELFARDAVSFAPSPATEGIDRNSAMARCIEPPSTRGIETPHGIDVSDPLVARDFFSVSMALDSTVVGHGRLAFDELCVYFLVAGDRIVSEQFFYTIEG